MGLPQLADLANFTQPWAISPDSLPTGGALSAAFKNNVAQAPIALEEIEREYYPESIALVKELTGASRVVLFDHSTSHPSSGRPRHLDRCANAPIH